MIWKTWNDVILFLCCVFFRLDLQWVRHLKYPLYSFLFIYYRLALKKLAITSEYIIRWFIGEWLCWKSHHMRLLTKFYPFSFFMQHLKECDIDTTKKLEHLELSKRFLVPTFFNLVPFWLLHIEKTKRRMNDYSHVLLDIFMYCRKLLGDELGSCAIDELQQIENQLERGLSKIRARKVQFNQVLLSFSY